jgi:hypothetical protein
VIVIAATDDQAAVRCTLGDAWQLAMHVRAEGWDAITMAMFVRLVVRIGIWHDHGMGAWWS